MKRIMLVILAIFILFGCEEKLDTEKILEDAAFQAASDHISSNHLRVEGQIIEEITLFGKGGEKLFHKKD